VLSMALWILLCHQTVMAGVESNKKKKENVKKILASYPKDQQPIS